MVPQIACPRIAQIFTEARFCLLSCSFFDPQRNVTLPSTRGTAFGVFNLFDDLGKGLGPALVSLIVAKSGREKAFTNAMLAWLACGAILLSTAFTVRRDEAKVCTPEFRKTLPQGR